MMFSDYLAGDSVIHRFSPGSKILCLLLVGTLLFLFPYLACVLTALGGGILLYPLAGIPLRTMLGQLKPLWGVLVLLLVVQGVITGWLTGILMVTRLVVLLLLAALITLTTRTTEMVDALERGLFWLRFCRINPAKVSLALALALRFIPVLAAITREVREAQKVRGLDRSVIAVAVPVIVRTLKMADDIAAALEARAYDATKRTPATDDSKTREGRNV